MLTWREDRFGVTGSGEVCRLYTLGNGRGMEADLTDYGAALVSLRVPDENGQKIDVVLGYDDPAGYERGGCSFGATVGRCANRIGGAAFELGGTAYRLDPNDNGRNNLHSGPDYYNKRLWKVADHGEGYVTFVLHSPDGDQGYPGALDMYVTYSLDEENMLRITYRAIPDQDTIINMTNHSYFNLNGHDSGSVLGHTLKMDADFFTPADKESIPTGEIRPVDGTPMDFREARPLGEKIDEAYEPLRLGGGYDHNWVLKNKGSFDKVAEVAADQSGIRMEVYTDLPGMQVYTSNFLDREPGKKGARYERRSAVCLETQYYPDAIHHDHFPGPVCRAGEEYFSSTAYRFTTRAAK